MSLTKTQIKYLRGLAQKLNPNVMVGKEQVTASLLKELDRALNDHELVKVKVQEEEKTDFIATAKDLADKSGAFLIQEIGRMAVYYRPSVNPDKRKISLPKR